MRLATISIRQQERPALALDNGSYLDLKAAGEIAKSREAFEAATATPDSILDVIMGGGRARELCDRLGDLAQQGELDDAVIDAGEAVLLAPIPKPRKNVFCVGSNYRAHVSEASKAQKIEDKTPKYPVFFSKPPTAVIGPGGEIRHDPAVSDKMDYEVELGIVFGAPGRNIAAADAAKHIFGFTIINDVTARDIQRRHGGQFLKGKGLDTSCPMGPCIVTIDELLNYENLRISTRVNGEERQDGNTGNMIFSIATLVESLSEGMTLEPGDLLATGTPSGVGYAMDPPQYLKGGDEITCEIEGIGALTNRVKTVGSNE